MDETFANLEDISDAQALERLENLFDSSSFPNLDDPPALDDSPSDPATSGSNFASGSGLVDDAVDGGTADGGIFAGPSSSVAESVPEMPPAPPVSSSSSTMPLLVPSGTITSSSTLVTTTVATPSASSSSAVTSASSSQPIFVATSTASAVSSGILPKGVLSNTPAIQTPQGLILNAQPTVISGHTLATSTGSPQMVQIQLQPTTGTAATLQAPLGGVRLAAPTTAVFAQQGLTLQSGATIRPTASISKQPQLLPKPTFPSSQPLQIQGKATTLAMTPSTGGASASSMPSLILNQTGVLTTMPSPTAAPLLINSLGQVVGSAGAASSPILIQQSTGNPVIVLRPQTGTTLPIVSQAASPATGTILLQQTPSATAATPVAAASPTPTAGTPNVITAQPQVKIITPQGRMQMQQIQTPTGPKLIAVPVGQTATVQATPQLAALSPFSSTPAAAPISSSSNINVIPAVVTTTAQQSTDSANTSSGKKKKSKKSKKKELQLPQQQQRGGGVDLGEMIKDIGIDLGEFGMDEPATEQDLTDTASQPLSHMPGIQLPTQPATLSLTDTGGAMLPAGTHIQSVPSAPAASASASSGSQLVAHIQQPLPLAAAGATTAVATTTATAASGQLQLIQGPDGQFVLQSTPTILTQQESLPGGQVITLPAGGVLPSVSSAVAIPSSSTAAVPAPSPSDTASTQRSSPTKFVTPSRPTARPSGSDGNRVPLYEDDRLPMGWHRKVSQRKSGASAGRYEVFIIGPSGKRFRSRNELKAFFEKTGEKGLDPEDFDFSTFGTGREKEQQQTTTPIQISPRSPVTASSSSVATMPVISPLTSAGVSSTASPVILSKLPQQKILQSQQQQQQQVAAPPGAAQAATILGLNQTSKPLAATNLLQNIQEPLPPTSLDVNVSTSQGFSGTPIQITSGVASSTHHFSSQISRETADADAQISQLLENLQKAPQTLSLGKDEKMAEFFKSLANESSANISAPGTPAIALAKEGISASSPLAVLASEPPAQPITTSAKDSIASSTTPKASKSTVQKTSGTTGFQASFLNSLATRKVSAEAGTSQVTLEPAQPQPSVSMGGGAPSQIRAFQNLPPNTRIVKGPNGQYSIQKIQTIELTQEQQTILKTIQTRIQELEAKTKKTPRDEADLIHLQTRQQHILASGKPVDVPAQAAIMAQQPTTTLSTTTHVVHSSGLRSNVQQTSICSVPLTGSHALTSPPTIAVKSDTVSTPQLGDTVKISTASPGNVDPGALPSTTPSIFGGAAGAGSVVPPLTEDQRKIVHDFKQRMAQLPPDKQAKFITENKAALIKQLNFQPAQLQMLRSNHLVHQQQQRIQQQQQQAAAAAAAVKAASIVEHVETSAAAVPIPTQQQPLLPTVPAATPIVLGEKRAAEASLSSAPSMKQKRVAWVESQVKKDQNEAVAPNYRAPFRSKEDSCKRLLRYHVFYELDESPRETMEEEEAYEARATALLSKTKSMIDKYHYLMVQESMRLTASSEVVMLARMWDTDERQAIAKDKEEFAKVKAESMVDPVISNPASIATSTSLSDAMPPPRPPSPPASIKTLTSPGDKDESLKDEKDEKFLGLKFHRSQSGNWKSNKEGDPAADSAYDEIEAIKKELASCSSQKDDHKPPPPLPVALTSASPSVSMPATSMSDSDEEFSLKDVDTDKSVGSILAGGAEEEEAVLDLPNLEEAGDDDVQSAINSILDIQGDGGRIETPDFNNLAGLLDSMDEGGDEQDPVTEAAVNSIL